MANQNNSRNNANASEIRKNFNTFANYALYGRDSSVDITEENYDYGNTYYLSVILSSDYTNEDIANYFNNFLAKYRTFVEQYNKLGDDNKNQSIINILADYDEKIDLLSYSTQYPLIGNNDILSVYIEEGGALEANSKIDSYYESYTKSTIENTVIFGNNLKEQMHNLISIYAQYDTLGCIDKINYTIQSRCKRNNTANFVSLNEGAQAFNEYMLSARGAVSTSSISTYQRIWDLKEMIYE